VVDDQSGCPTAASDIASAIMRIVAALLMEKRDGFGTFHFAGAGTTTWYGFAREIFQQAEERGYAARPRLTAIASQDFPTPAVRPSNSVLDTTRIRDVYGIEARPWQNALSETLDVLLGPPDDDRPPGCFPTGVLPA
jgi:dTDP-4-dehydrorhamnose reductase